MVLFPSTKNEATFEATHYQVDVNMFHQIKIKLIGKKEPNKGFGLSDFSYASFFPT